MPIYARQPESNFTPCPEGLHQVVCVDVIDLGLVDGQWGEAHQVRLVWQTEAEDERGRPFQLRKQYRLSLHEKARLRSDLETWRGRKFTADELRGFDLEKLVGANGQAQVIHNIKDEGRVYCNIQALIPIGAKMPKIAARDYTRDKDKPKEPTSSGGNGVKGGVPPPSSDAIDQDDFNADEIPF